MDERLKQYLAGKYPSEFDKFSADYGDEALNRAEAKAAERKSGLGLAQFAAGVGDAMAGRDPSNSAKNFRDIRQGIDDETVGAFQKKKDSAIKDLSTKRAMSASDPRSQESQSFRKTMEANFPKITQLYGDDWGNISAADKDLVLDPLRMREQRESRLESAQALAADRAAAREAKQDEIRAKKEELGTEGERAVDKDYAKQYTEFTGKGAVNAAQTIKQLKELQAELDRESKGTFQSGGGRLTPILPDSFRTTDSLRWKTEIPGKANLVLKDLFGGQLSDAERKSESQTYYNDLLGPAENSKLLGKKIETMEKQLQSEIERTKYFEQNRTLKGFKYGGGNNDQRELSGDDQSAKRRARIAELKAKAGRE